MEKILGGSGWEQVDLELGSYKSDVSRQVNQGAMVVLSAPQVSVLSLRPCGRTTAWIGTLMLRLLAALDPTYARPTSTAQKSLKRQKRSTDP